MKLDMSRLRVAGPALLQATPALDRAGPLLRGAASLAVASATRSHKGLARVTTALTAPKQRVEEVSMDLRGPILAGCAIIGIGLGAFGTFVVAAPLKSAVVAHGVVAVDSKRKVVQHLEGGIVSELAVQEGQTVKAGDLLMRLDDTQSAARRSQSTAKLVTAAAEKARLEAELSDALTLTLDPALASMHDHPDMVRALALQQDLFRSRREERSQRRLVLDRQIEQIADEIRGLEAQVLSREKRRALSVERLEGLRQLAGKGYASRVQVAGLEAEIAGADGEIGDLTARISAANQKSAQIREQILNLEAGAKAEIADRLQSTRRDVSEAREALAAATDVQRRTDLRSPIAGTIVGLKVHTVGAVVGAGEALMEIVPSEDSLVVEAALRPEDIDSVHPGLPVEVRLTAYSFRSTPPVPGTLVQVSADRIVDARSGTASYQAKAVFSKQELEANKKIHLQAGMPAEVVIIKGERTLLDYLVDPILQVTERAFLER